MEVEWRWKIPEDILKNPPGDVFEEIIKTFREKLMQDKAASNKSSEEWEYLIKYDNHSTWSYLALAHHPAFNYETIQWMEAFNGGTEWYDQALRQAF